MSENDALSSKQRKAIAALLSERTIEAAAQVAGINARTIYRWMDSSDFRQALLEIEIDAIDAAARRLIGGKDAALDTLAELMLNADSESVRKQAACDWLDYLLKLRELRSIEKRLIALEETINGKDK
jgi:hypothetical protein